MNRREEYWVLTEQLRREPPELESAVRRGMDRARRRRRRPAELLAGLAGVCAAFVVMVNASPAFAISCAKVPVKYEADEIKRRQKEEKAQREAEPVMA